jgi:glucan phosphoethanolaminetransferase (alkaline phosphatase superfamily)
MVLCIWANTHHRRIRKGCNTRMLQTSLFATSYIPFLVTLGMLIAAILFWRIKAKYSKWLPKVCLVSCSAIFLVWLIISLNLIAIMDSQETPFPWMMQYDNFPFPLISPIGILFPLEIILMIVDIFEQIKKIRSSQQ